MAASGLVEIEAAGSESRLGEPEAMHTLDPATSVQTHSRCCQDSPDGRYEHWRPCSTSS